MYATKWKPLSLNQYVLLVSHTGEGLLATMALMLAT
jgi:hypothetical protein